MYGDATMIENEYVKEEFKQRALVKLQSRRRMGESDFEITGIRDEHAYYRDKLCAGLTAMSYTVYDRIMGCSKEDA